MKSTHQLDSDSNTSANEQEEEKKKSIKELLKYAEDNWTPFNKNSTHKTSNKIRRNLQVSNLNYNEFWYLFKLDL